MGKEYEDQVEGRNSVIELLESGKDINKIFITKGEHHGSIHKIIEKTVKSDKWRGKFTDPRIFYTLFDEEYFDILSELTDEFEMWRTIYFHRMAGVESIIEWYKSTGLKPYLEALSKAESEDFLGEIRLQLEKEYTKQKNGEVIFRFPRLFFIATKNEERL